MDNKKEEKVNAKSILNPQEILPPPSTQLPQPSFCSLSDSNSIQSESSLQNPNVLSEDQDELGGVGYDSDCLVIVECDPVDCQSLSPGDALEMSQSSGGGGSFNNGESNIELSSNESQSNSLAIKANVANKIVKAEVENDEEIYTHKKLHNLPINELKRKLAYCPVCQIQCPNHKIANLCLNKHGKRQCWLCLEVMSNTKDSYFQHCVMNHAVRPSSDMVACPYCQKFFDFRQGINQHIVKVHFSEDTSFFSITACLSPGSLVDLYTGKCRSDGLHSKGKKVRSVGSGKNQDDNSTTNPVKSKVDSKSGVGIGATSLSVDKTEVGNVRGKSVSIEEIKIIRNIPEGVGGTVAQISSRKNPNRITTRESVIRETPAAISFSTNKTSTLSHDGMSFGIGRSTCGRSVGIETGISGNSCELNLLHLQHQSRPQSHPPAHFSKHRTDIMSVVGLNEGESESLTLPQRPYSDPHEHTLSQLPLLHSCRNPNLTDFDILSSTMKYIKNFSAQQIKGNNTNVEHYPSAPQKESQEQQKQNEGILHIQKMVQQQEISRVPLDYYNSVKTMLKTVADYGPKDSVEGNGSGESGTTNIGFEDEGQLVYYNKNDIMGTCQGLDDPQPSSIEDGQFKIPTHAGVKRRILTKWDEHQERKSEVRSSGNGGNTYFNPSSQVDFSYRNDNQMASLESALRSTGGMQSMTEEDRQFWEQVIQESNSMYKNRENNSEVYQRQCQEFQFQIAQQQATQLAEQQKQQLQLQRTQQQQQQQQYLPPNSFSRTNESHYPRIMQRVDSHGRPVSTNVAQTLIQHNQPYKTDKIEMFLDSETASTSQLMVYSPTQTHKQYEYRIIQQAASNGGNPSANPQAVSNLQVHKISDYKVSQHLQHQQLHQLDQPNANIRKRKSLFPSRVVQQEELSPYDSILVQNPFEEEEIPYNKSYLSNFSNNYISDGGVKKPKEMYNNINPASQSATLSPTKAQYDAALLHQQLHQHQQNVQLYSHRHQETERIVNCQQLKKFPTEGQITEYQFQKHQQQRMIKQPQEQSRANENTKGESSRLLHNGSVPQQTTNYSGDMGLDGRLLVKPNQTTLIECQNGKGTWPPFIVAPRYQERCRSIAYQLKEMQHRLIDKGGRGRNNGAAVIHTTSDPGPVIWH